MARKNPEQLAEQDALLSLVLYPHSGIGQVPPHKDAMLRLHGRGLVNFAPATGEPRIAILTPAGWEAADEAKRQWEADGFRDLTGNKPKSRGAR